MYYYGYSKQYDFLRYSETLFIDALKTYEREDQPFLFFCWSPHYLIDKYGLEFVKEEETDLNIWELIIKATKDEKVDPKPGTKWPKTSIKIAYSKRLIEYEERFVRLLNAFKISNKDRNYMVFRMKDGNDALRVAAEWLNKPENHKMVLTWLLPRKEEREHFEKVGRSINY